jgi:DNA damage-binding protein 2
MVLFELKIQFMSEDIDMLSGRDLHLLIEILGYAIGVFRYRNHETSNVLISDYATLKNSAKTQREQNQNRNQDFDQILKKILNMGPKKKTTSALENRKRSSSSSGIDSQPSTSISPPPKTTRPSRSCNRQKQPQQPSASDSEDDFELVTEGLKPDKKDTFGIDSQPSTLISPPPKTTRASRSCTRQKQPQQPSVSDSEDDFEPVNEGLKPDKKDTKKPAKKSPDKKDTKKPAKKSSKKKDENANESCQAAAFLDEKPVDTNIISALTNFQSGVRRQRYCIEHCARSVIVNQLKDLAVYKSITHFDRRVTAMAWHPKNSNLCAVASKGGDIILWNINKDVFEGIAKGIGPGGSIQQIKFDVNNSSRVYTCSIDGTFEAMDLSMSGAVNKETFLNTNTNQNWEKWYTTFDVSPDGMTLIAGENSGFVTLLSSNGETIWRDKLHKAKVTCIEFSPREPWLFVTTSTDNTAKVWDIRNLTNADDDDSLRKTRFLQDLPHDKAVNSAYFSSVDGTRLLTTDQHSQLRVYKAPFWDLERIIPHPHRQFQHLTPIKATWHPLVDLVVSGRYPDDKFPGTVAGELRTIDIINPQNGNMECQINQAGFSKISSLNVFSPTGHALLSGMGQTVVIWKQKVTSEVEYKEKTTDGIMVEEWPGYKVKAKAASKKKTKQV